MSFDNFVHQQQSLTGQLFRENIKLSSGQAISAPSENPLAMSRILDLSGTQLRQEQIIDNIQFASTFMGEAENALTDVTGLLNRVLELASASVTSLALPAEREAAAVEIDSILNEMMHVANRTYLDLYLFGGKNVTTRPVVEDLGGIHYLGDSGRLHARTSERRDEDFTFTADDVFTMLSTEVQGFVDLNPAVTLDTRLDELNGVNGQGIRLGSLHFEEQGPAGAFNVDLTAANTVGQVIDLINHAAAAAGSSLSAGLNDQRTGIMLTPGDALTITSQDNGAVAGDLGVLSNAAGTAPIVGGDLERRVTPTTRLADLFAGAGIAVAADALLVRNGELSASIDLSAAATVQDILNAINNAGVGARARINDAGDGLNVLNEVSGVVMTIEEQGGTTATDLGIRTFHAGTRLQDLNFGKGVRHNDGQDDFEIQAKDGSTVVVNIDTAVTVQDLIDLINQAADDAGVNLEASLATTGNGIRILDGTNGPDAIAFEALKSSPVLQDLGLDVSSAAADVAVIGTDVAGVRVPGLFTALLELRDALLRGSEVDITAATQEVDASLADITRRQGLIGAEVRALEQRVDQTQQAIDSTNILLAEVRDLDYAEAIAKFQQTQTTLQASLLASGQSLNLSLLNFLR